MAALMLYSAVLSTLLLALCQANPNPSPSEVIQTLAFLKKSYDMGAVLTFQQSDASVSRVCANGNMCAYNSTCCDAGCCNHQNGVCCEGSSSCCPQGYECSAQGRDCVKIETQLVLDQFSVASNDKEESTSGLTVNELGSSSPDNGCVRCKILCCSVQGIKFCCP